MLKYYTLAIISLLFWAFCIFATNDVQADTILAITPNNTEFISEILTQTTQKLSQNSPSLTIQHLPATDKDDDYGNIVQHIKETHPDIILLIGKDIAKKLTKDFPKIPIIISDMFTPGYMESFNDSPFVIINTLYIPIEKRLEYAQKIFTINKKIGIMYNPQKNSDIIENAQKYSDTHNIELIRIPILNEKDFQSINKLNIDILLLIPDTQVCSIPALKYILPLCTVKHIPILGISEYFAQYGTVAAIIPNIDDYTHTLAKTIAMTANNNNVEGIPDSFPEKIDYFINLSIQHYTKVKLNPGIIENAKKTFGK